MTFPDSEFKRKNDIQRSDLVSSKPHDMSTIITIKSENGVKINLSGDTYIVEDCGNGRPRKYKSLAWADKAFARKREVFGDRL
jgi:hypothetical protein